MMCKSIEDMRKQEREEGFEIGVKEGIKMIALRMLSTGEYTVEEISKLAGMPLDELQKLTNPL